MAKADTRKLKDKAIGLVHKGKLDKALLVYQSIVKADPKDIKIWVKIGDLYRKLSRPEQAIEIYAKAARSFAMNGFLMQAISVNKMILELEPSHQETQQALAELYAKKEGDKEGPAVAGGGRAVPAASLAMLEQLKKKSKDKVAAAPPPPPPSPPPEPEPVEPEPIEPEPIEPEPVEPEPVEPEPEEIVIEPEIEVEEDLEPAAIEEEVIETTGMVPAFDALDIEGADDLFDSIMNQDEVDLSKDESAESFELVLPNIPLFSSLEADEFTGIVEKLQLRRFDVGDKIIKEGETGDSFYIIARGSARVLKRDPGGDEVYVADLEEGTFFGEFAFFNESVRHASVVVSKEMEALEIGRDDLEELIGQFPRIREVMQTFYRQRLLGSLLAISPLFKPFPEEKKRELLAMFEQKKYDAGSIVIKQGKEGEGLFLILSGEIVVNVKTPEGIVEVAMLSEGSFFGEISLITDKLTTANCMAADDLEVLFLPRKTFKELILTHPQILEVAAEFGEQRVKANKSLMASGEDGLARAGMV